MKNFFLAAIALASLNLFASPLFAHTPSEIEMTYDASTQTADIFVAHSVSDPESHFVKEIEIWVNQGLLKRVMFMNQETAGRQEYKIEIPNLKEGDRIDVKAECSESGTLMRTFEI